MAGAARGQGNAWVAPRHAATGGLLVRESAQSCLVSFARTLHGPWFDGVAGLGPPRLARPAASLAGSGADAVGQLLWRTSRIAMLRSKRVAGEPKGQHKWQLTLSELYCSA